MAGTVDQSKRHCGENLDSNYRGARKPYRHDLENPRQRIAGEHQQISDPMPPLGCCVAYGISRSARR
jgi:hypothetical protein